MEEEGEQSLLFRLLMPDAEAALRCLRGFAAEDGDNARAAYDKQDATHADKRAVHRQRYAAYLRGSRVGATEELGRVQLF